jgi:tetratricopeptide (TPR) repeat protein
MKKCLLFLLFPVAVFASSPEAEFKLGLEQYKIGSYSTALEHFLNSLVPGSKIYHDSLLWIAKTYYAIGRKTGDKKYLWQALSHLQLFLAEAKQGQELNWNYYYTKAKIYEGLGFYEQALANYRVAFLKAKTNSEKIETTIGIVRTALWLKKPQMAEEYYILISTSKLSPEQEREVEFVKGLLLFIKGEYEKAYPYFYKVYRKYENYLIDNPEYYYLVAENFYRLSQFTFAEQLFRRIISLTRDKSIIRRSLLRLGDIELRKGNHKLAFIYYYSVIRDSPDSPESLVARLKIIPLLSIPDVKYRAELSKEKAFKDPIKYIAKLLVNYRTTYVGIYALADFGYLVLSLNSPQVIFDRLTWEVSLLFPEKVKYEQREFIRKLWTPYLLSLDDKRACSLYRANPRFFQEIFNRKVLLKFASSLKACNMRKLRISLLDFMVKRWRKDQDIIMMAGALYEEREFKDALRFLSYVKNREVCDYWKLYFKLGMYLPLKLPEVQKLFKLCGKEDSDALALAVYYLVKNGKLNKAFGLFEENKEKLVELYSSMETVKACLEVLMEENLVSGNYDVVFSIANSLIEGGFEDCHTLAFYTISGTRLMKDVEREFEKLSLCKDSFAHLAQIIYKDSLLEREVRNE